MLGQHATEEAGLGGRPAPKHMILAHHDQQGRAHRTLALAIREGGRVLDLRFVSRGSLYSPPAVLPRRPREGDILGPARPQCRGAGLGSRRDPA